MAGWDEMSGSDIDFAEDAILSSAMPRTPQAVNPDLHDLINALTAVGLGINANFIWLDREQPDVDAAKRTSKKLIEDFCRLERLLQATAILDR
ncbi:hypothetical protein N7E02_14135 [Aliirhizobium terrae]|uniref:hypothetical protein n=1 Tax=Terrirhizobium terrae TaxID=2926709 RepID=UPI0025776845|nr:hypothetical protein [Rhizobium sp. CC-CFT758]WJH41500.1 hypothetical protein N7E02_14135 [Rhizobium sp. CC-CFT758]